MSGVDILILALATYRLSMLFAIEDGMFGFFDKIRKGVGVKEDKYGQMYGDDELSKMIICMYCNSVWIGGLVVSFYMLVPYFTYMVLPLALSGAVVLIKELS